LHVHRAERGVVGLDEFGLLLCKVAGAVVIQDEAADAMPAEIVGDDVALPVVGKVAAAEDLLAAVLRATGVQTLQHARCVGRGGVAAAWDQVVYAFGPRAVGDERLAPAVKVVAPGVPPAASKDLQPFRLGPKLPNAASAQSPNAVGRLDVAMDVDGLIHVEHAVRAPAKGVQHVMGVFGAETGQDDLAAGGFAFAVGVAEMEEVGAG